MKELTIIQTQLKAPKGNYNSFGKYKYRSCADILEAVKPLLAETGCTITLSDRIEHFDGSTPHYYVCACAQLTNAEGDIESVFAYAREEEEKKGMDAAQITGAASSYARKYALCGLLAIDDTDDPDVTNTHGADTKKAPKAAPKAAPAPAPVQSIDLKAIEQRAMATNSIQELVNLYRELQNANQTNKDVNDVFAKVKKLKAWN